MEVESSVPEAELRLLHQWLRQDRQAAGPRVTRVEGRGRPDEMGTALDALQLVTGNAWSAAAFVVSVLTWRQTRPRPPRVTLRRGEVEVTLTDGTDDEIRRVVALLETADGEASLSPEGPQEC
ncbi:hypothetical protein HW445_31100 [Streptomyces sp. UH6]|nr:hypothetical protein [Streptomyces sp. UH6]